VVGVCTESVPSVQLLLSKPAAVAVTGMWRVCVSGMKQGRGVVDPLCLQAWRVLAKDISRMRVGGSLLQHLPSAFCVNLLYW
jgi:hypothetical protein